MKVNYANAFFGFGMCRSGVKKRGGECKSHPLRISYLYAGVPLRLKNGP